MSDAFWIFTLYDDRCYFGLPTNIAHMSSSTSSSSSPPNDQQQQQVVRPASIEYANVGDWLGLERFHFADTSLPQQQQQVPELTKPTATVTMGTSTKD
ncbi:hypothetical protein BASA81_009881 [Batrachochytrium salamandrivorans]|nr:hypothetical protein BASA81_009881 [Batrachochytrium salamandrivorans]